MLVREILGDAGATENITPGDTATGITASKRCPTSGLYKGMTAAGALITCESNSVNFTFDGTDPTAAAGTNVGHSLGDSDSIVIRGQTNVANFKCIDRVSGSAATVKVTTLF